MRNCAVLVLLMIAFTACNNNGIDTNSKGEKTFTYTPLGWTMVLPNGWKVFDESELDKLNYASQNYYEEAQSSSKEGEKKIILAVKKQDSSQNACYAFIRSYQRDEDYPRLRDLLRQQKRAYETTEAAKRDYTTTDTVIKKEIGGHLFEKAILTISYKGNLYFTNITYSTMIDTLNFGVNITAGTQVEEQLLVDNFEESVKNGIGFSKQGTK